MQDIFFTSFSLIGMENDYCPNLRRVFLQQKQIGHKRLVINDKEAIFA